jgi:hypothetical protein
MPVVNLPILIAVALVLIIALLAWFIGTRQSRVRPSEVTRQAIADARIDPGEHEASVIAEQIEEMVRRSLAAHLDLATMNFDLGTGSDGGLVFWINEVAYEDAAAIPDPRIREAVAAAVKQFNS